MWSNHKFFFSILVLLFLIAFVYGSFVLASQKRYPVEWGISFNQDHAASLGLDWKKAYTDMLSELKPKYIRIAAMWSDVEAQQGTYNFSNVDYMMNEAKKHGAKVLLVVGQKAPRWPECHIPTWVTPEIADKQEKLFAYVKAVGERYKSHEALEIWQVENEPFIRFPFGECGLFREDAVKQEIQLVKSIDAKHKVLVTDSGELSTWRLASRAGDLFGTTVYRIVRHTSGVFLVYDWVPAAFYRFKAKLWGRPVSEMFVAELQAEPWFTTAGPKDTPIEEQEKSMNPLRLEKHMDFVEHIGVPRAYLWGVEWWYWMKKERNDSRYWELVRNKIASSSSPILGGQN